MIYLEELKSGEAFLYDGVCYVVSRDFKNTGHRLCIDLRKGFGVWLDPSSITEKVTLMYTDKENNFIPITIME